MPVHPRLSLNSISSMKQSLDADLALWAELGIDHVGLISPKFEAPGWDAGRDAVRAAGLRVASMSCYPGQIPESLAFSAAVDAKVLYVVTGSAGALSWE